MIYCALRVVVEVEISLRMFFWIAYCTAARAFIEPHPNFESLLG